MRRVSSVLVILLALFTVGCDQSTKRFALETLQMAPLQFFPGVTLTYAENHDMAFGLLEPILGAEARLWLLSLAKAFAIVIGMTVIIWRRKISTVWERVSLALILSGALGNLIDRVHYGYVIDFVKVPYWPVFNVADVAIVVGFGLLLVEAWRREQPNAGPA